MTGFLLTRPEPVSSWLHTHIGHLLCEALCWELGPASSLAEEGAGGTPMGGYCPAGRVWRA